MPKLKDRFKKGLSIGSALGVVLSGVFLSPLSIDPPALSSEIAVASVSISTPETTKFTTETVEFTANTTGSQGNLTYTWERKRSGETTWTTVATSGTSYTTPALTLADDQSQYRVTVDSAINGTSDSDESNSITLSVSDIVQHYLVFDVDATDLASFDPRTPGVLNDRSGTVTSGSTFAGTNQTESGLFEFDGTGDYVDIGDFPDSVDFSDGLTVDFVADFGSRADNFERIFDFGNGGSDNIVVSRNYNTAAIRYYVVNSAGRGQLHDFNGVIEPGLHRYTLVVDDDNTELFVDGSSVESHIFDANAEPSSALRQSNLIGKSNFPNDAEFEGAVEYLRIFNYSFDAASLDIIDPDFKTVSFDSQGGATVADKKSSGSMLLPSAGINPGREFGGWFTDATGGSLVGQPGDTYSPDKTVTLYAAWNFTLELYSEGAAIDTQTIASGSSAVDPQISRAGYDLLGWDTDPSADSAVYQANLSDFNMPPNDEDLYAVWGSGFYQTTFDAFGGTVTNTVVQVPLSTGIELPLPERPSFTFLGWVDANDNPVGTNGDIYTPTINETLTATWVQDSRFGVNPANLSDLLNTTLNGQGIDTTISQGDISIRIVVPQEAFSQEVAIDMDLFTNNDLQESILGSESNYVLSVLLSWISGSGSSATVPDTDQDHPIVLTISDPDIKAGARIYKVIGTRVENLGVATQDGEITVDIFEDPSIVVAATKPDQVVFSSVSAGDEQATLSWSEPGNGGSAITGYTVTSNLGDSCSVVSTTCTITGLTNGTSYTFTVTATNSVGTSDPSAVSAAVVPSFVTYPVVFDSNGGSNFANTTYPRLGSITKPADPILLGYTFGGWSTVLDDEQTVVDFSGGSYNPSVDEAQTFYALWSANDNTVTFKANFENEADQTQVITTDVETALTINSFERPGHRFLGWAESESGDVVYEDEELVTIKEPMTLWAVWSRNSSPAEESFEAEDSVSKPDYSESGGARPGETIEFEIAGGQRVTPATVGDVAVEFRETTAGFEITVPESLSPGIYDLVVNIGGEEVVYKDYVVILASVIPDTRFWTKRISDTEAKVYIKYVRLGEQYSIGHQTGGSGEYAPVTTITANNFEDDRLRFAIGAYYIVRTITLEPGINRINVYVNGEQQELRGRMDPVRYTNRR